MNVFAEQAARNITVIGTERIAASGGFKADDPAAASRYSDGPATIIGVANGYHP